MRRGVRAALLASLLPALASAEEAAGLDGDRLGSTSSPVIGGTTAALGKWPDVAAVQDLAGDQFCTGTLIAPTVVLTAGHCISSDLGSVLVGTASLERQVDGEVLPVVKRVEYPSSWTSYDVGVLVLGSPSRFAPRPIATGWAALDIKNGAVAAIAGYGAIDREAQLFTRDLQEATTTITDASCSTSAGCNQAALPNGELGAGGMGIDTCPGDSGGPLYLVTDYGAFLAGVTSRGYDNNSYFCSEGGIYGRPDKIVDWIEETAGVEVTRGPEPATKDPLVAVRGHAAESTLVANDPRSSRHTFAIAQQPIFGTAAVNGDGRIRVCTKNDIAGKDTVAVTVTDQDDPTRTITAKIPFEVVDGDPGEDCDPNAFDEDGGCCESGRSSSGAVPLALGVLFLVGRRRRR